MNYYNEFKKYATKHKNISGSKLHYWEKQQNHIIDTQASLTPYILEEREMRATQIDIFSRLLMDRIIWVNGTVNDHMSTIVQAQLMFLDNFDVRDIIMHVDSPGGSVKSGLSIVDVMNYISSDISTINTGMAASMGSILLGAGTKGKRHTLKYSRVMLHQVSSGAEGTLADMMISLKEAEKYNDLLFGLLGEYCNKDPKQIMKDAQRDLWLSSEEAIKYGIVDTLITTKKEMNKKKK
jgi:ATP-dependent Clp protease protease subunit